MGSDLCAININNLEIEKFISEEFKNDENTLLDKFVEFIRFQKIKKDVEIANLEFDNGDFLDIDSAFLEVTSKYVRN